MRSFLQTIGLDRLLRPLPTGVVRLISFGAVLAFAVDLLLPDFIPVIDEALLGLLVVAGFSELGERKRLPGAPSRARTSAPRGTGPQLRSLAGRVGELITQARHLRADGSAVLALDGLAALQDLVADLLDDLKKADVFLSRRENDPWLLGQRITKMERRVARPDSDSTAARSEVERLRAHRLRVEAVVGDREDLLGRLLALSAQVDTLLGDLRALAVDPDATDFSVAALPDLDPRVEAVLRSVQEMREAEAELQDALRAGRSRDPAPHLN